MSCESSPYHKSWRRTESLFFLKSPKGIFVRRRVKVLLTLRKLMKVVFSCHVKSWGFSLSNLFLGEELKAFSSITKRKDPPLRVKPTILHPREAVWVVSLSERLMIVSLREELSHRRAKGSCLFYRRTGGYSLSLYFFRRAKVLRISHRIALKVFFILYKRFDGLLFLVEELDLFNCISLREELRVFSLMYEPKAKGLISQRSLRKSLILED